MKKHSAMNRRLMLEWLRDCDDTGVPMPTDAAIVERFGFASEELARGLLADLAEAKLILVTGVGRDRAVTLPHHAPLSHVPVARSVAERLPPAVRRGDSAVDRVVGLITTLNEQAGRLKRAVPPSPVPGASSASEEPKMPRKPAPSMSSHLAPAAKPQPSPTESGIAPSVSAIMQELLREAGGSIDWMIVKLIGRVTEAEAASQGQRPEDAAAITALTKRAEEAEGKLATLKALFA